MRPSLRTAWSARRLPTVTFIAAALCAGMTVLTPAASATTAAPQPVTCETTSRSMLEPPQIGLPSQPRFEGTGTVTCRDAQGEPYLEGESTFSGTLPSLDAIAAGGKPVFRSRVDWSDGTVTTGTFTDFRTEPGENGVLELTIKGANDVGSTRFGGWSVSAAGQSVRVGVDPSGEIVNAQTGRVTYTP
ncbi:hypothetical protein [Streptomyces cavernicola]|uniref:Uncharacterized protein n=1 Tax=Streptomyces cavernicola TaxID=3043613 RepID=A0ABT6SLQ4_9ACTN|nr:hypothetical protein [Streptomyces sp. B-S-A6]MDI3408900.1 hypothetical protein [Streptomyces sp. B-S-A6]